MPENTDANAERRMLLAIASQPVDTNPTYTVGGDVSRFQPRTVSRRGDGPSEDDRRARQVGEMIGAIAQRVGGERGAVEGGFRASAGTAAAAPVPTGPVVRVTRGNNSTVVPVGAR